MCEARTKSVMATSPRRDFLKLAFGGALAAAGAALESASARASAEPLEPPSPFAPDNVLDMARELAKSPFKAPKSTLPDVFSSLNFEQYSAIRRSPGSARVERRKIRLRARAAAPRLHFHDADAAAHRRERSGAATDLRPRRLRLRQTATAGRPARSRLFRRARAQGGPRPGMAGFGDLPGRDIFSQPGARPDLRRQRARPVDPHRRRAGRGISAVPRAVDRKAKSGRRTR